MKVIKVGIIDDDGSKVTQMMAYLLYGMKDASKQKADRYSNVRFEVLEIPLSADMNDIAEQCLIPVFNLPVIYRKDLWSFRCLF